MKEKFIKAVEEGDLIGVRLFLSNELMLDPRGHSYAEMKAYAESKLSDLYDAFTGKEYDVPENQWTQSHLFAIKNDLDSNFSKKRLNYYERVAKSVLKKKAESLDREEEADNMKGASSEDREKGIASESSSVQNKKGVYSLITVGGVVVTIVGLCMAKAVLTTMGLAGIVVGGFFLYEEIKK